MLIGSINRSIRIGFTKDIYDKYHQTEMSSIVSDFANLYYPEFEKLDEV